MPHEVAAPLLEAAQLRETLAQVFRMIESARERGRCVTALFVAMAVVFLVVGPGSAALMVSGGTARFDLSAAASVGAVAAAYVILALSLVIGVFHVRRRNERLLATRPFVTLEFPASRRLECRCPGCGAAVSPAPSELVARCGHCGIEALLPAVMVNERLQARHHRLLSLRRRGEVLAGVALSTTKSVQYSLGIGLLVVGVLGGIAIAVAFAYVYWTRERLNSSAFEQLEFIIGGLVGVASTFGVFGVGGLVSMKAARDNARKRSEAAQGR